MSSRSQWVFQASASSGLCSDTELPRRCCRPGRPPALSSGSLRWTGQGSPVTSTKHSAETTSCLVSWAYVSWALAYVSESVRVDTHIDTHTHRHFLARQKKAQPDLQTSRILLECRPSLFAKRPLGVTVNPFMWCDGLNQTPQKADMTRGAVGQQVCKLLHCMALMTALRRAALKLSSPGERLKKTTRVSMCVGEVSRVSEDASKEIRGWSVITLSKWWKPPRTFVSIR